MKFNKTLEERVKTNLAGFQSQAKRDENLKRAAVSIVIARHEDRAAFLLTRRTARLNSHAGQWALPGGRLDPGETGREAALREIHEEIGLGPDDVRILGRLDDYPTRSGYLITPFVLWASPEATLVANPDEVASIHHIPVSELQKDGSVEFLTIPESERPVIRLHFQDNQVHAPTAAVIHQFNEVALNGRDTRVAHLEQPVWAWK